jgi:hypothetical protein
MKIQLRRQLSVAIENEPGRLGQVCRLLAERSIHIDAFSVINNVEQGMVRLMTSDTVATRDVLKERGLPFVEAEVLCVELTDCVGSLALLGETLAAAGINIEYAYASTTEIGQPARVILKTNSSQKACEILTASGAFQ